MASEGTIFDEPHYLALERLAARALVEKRYETAFRLSDRRCRITPPPMPHSFLLRAEASFRMGDKRHGIADLLDALTISPNDVQANRRMLAWGEGAQQQTAARALLSSDRDINVLRRALNLLGDQDQAAYASVNVLDLTIEGWAVWSHDGPAEITIVSRSSTVSYFLEPDPLHALRTERLNAAGFVLSRPMSDAPQSISASIAGHRFFSLRAPGNEPSQKTPVEHVGKSADTVATTVIVPIYDDFAATKACLASLSEAAKLVRDCRLVLVNDAAPDERIRRHLAGYSGRPGIEILTNARNLGFVGSVNRALGVIPCGDIILLNSDTIVPPGFIDRLASAAHSASDIGTVIPLSNNGEFSSFPLPNEVNELGSLEDVIRLDQVAASANRDVVVDIPSGIGFCLYVTRACLDAVGQLSESYQRGYLEDVDFCMRARELGFRSVCAPSVYVGHAGSRSFRDEKRSLVIRNLEVLSRKFPSYREVCSAFMVADPIRSARERVERKLSISGARPRLIIGGRGAIAEVVRSRAGRLQSGELSAITVEIGYGTSGMVVRPIGLDGAVPQNIEFAISDPHEMQSFEAYLDDLRPTCIEIWDTAGLPEKLLERLIDGRTPCEFVVADAGMFVSRPWSFDEVLSELAPGPDGGSLPAIAPSARSRHWRSLLSKAGAIVVPCSMAAAFAARLVTDVKLTTLDETIKRPRRRKKPGTRTARRLGLIPLRVTADEFLAMKALVRIFHEHQPDLSITVIGETIDDLALMRFDNCFVTGPVKPADIERILAQYELESLFVGLGAPLFGHPLEHAALRSGLPIARLDWSFGGFRVQDQDVVIDPRLGFSEMANVLARWLEGR